MPRDKRKMPARTGGSADPTSGDVNELKHGRSAAERHPQGAGGVDVADNAGRRRRRQAERRLARVLR